MNSFQVVFWLRFGAGAPDADGNSTGGLMALDVAVPIGTYAGRNTRAAGFSEGELCSLFGSYVPFAATRQKRVASSDPRLSLEEHYPTPQNFSEKRKRTAEALVQQHLLLPEDAAVILGTVSSQGASREDDLHSKHNLRARLERWAR